MKIISKKRMGPHPTPLLHKPNSLPLPTYYLSSWKLTGQQEEASLNCSLVSGECFATFDTKGSPRSSELILFCCKRSFKELVKSTHCFFFGHKIIWIMLSENEDGKKNTNCFISNTKAELKKLKKKNICVPIPGVEPGPPGWKPGILTARPYGRSHTRPLKFVILITFEYVN